METDSARVADYFVVCGLNANSRPTGVSNGCDQVLDGHAATALEYVTDITAIRVEDKFPADYLVRSQTSTGHKMEFSSGVKTHFYLCFKKSRDSDGPLSPIAEIRVFLSETSLPRDFRLVEWHNTKKPVNFGLSMGKDLFLGFRTTILHAHTVAITDLALINVDKTALRSIQVVVPSSHFIERLQGEVPPSGFKRLKKNLNIQFVTRSRVHLCYKLAMPKPKAVFYSPGILSYFPTKEYFEEPLDRNILSFCMPAGVSIEVFDQDMLCPLPTSANFVFTREDGIKSYGVAVTLYEPVPDELRQSDMLKSLNVDARDKPVLYMSKAIVITAKWPFFDAFRTFLTTLYRISISKSPLPLERYIYNFMREIPFPKPDGSRVLMQIGPESIQFSPPVNTLMPLNTAPFHTLLQYLNPKNVITLLHLVLLEQRIVLLSSVQSTLISVAESIQCLLYPFEWQTPYIPYILDTMTDMLDAPVPFIFGIHALDFDVNPYVQDPNCEVSFIDLDSDFIYEGISPKEMARLALPKGPIKTLRRRLSEIRQAIIEMGLSADDLAIDLAPINVTNRLEEQLAHFDLLIQDAVLRFMIQLFNQYRHCLIKPLSVTIDHNECFNRKEFLQTVPKIERSFYSEFFETQMFQKFIQDCFTAADNKLNFFDTCIKKINSGEGKDPLIEYFQIHPDAVVTTNQACSAGLPHDKTYSYSTFPNLDISLFPEEVDSPMDKTKTNFSQQLDITRVLKDATKYKLDPFKWPKFLLGQCYSLWFLYLPTFIQNKSSSEQIHIGNECLLLLEAIRSKDVLVTDEVAYLKLMELGSEQKDLQLVSNIWKEIERAHNSSSNLFTLYTKALDNCYKRRAQVRWKKSIIAIQFCISLYNSVSIVGGSPFSKSLVSRGDVRRRVVKMKKKTTLGSFYPDKESFLSRLAPLHRQGEAKEGTDVMVEDEENLCEVEVMKQVVLDPGSSSMLDSDSEDSLFNPKSLSPSPPPPEPSRYTPSPVSILTLPPVQMLREAKKYFKHSIRKDTSDKMVNIEQRQEPSILINNEESDAAFINKAMAPQISDRSRNSIQNEIESSMVFKTVSFLQDGMTKNRLSNSQILTSKDSGFTEFCGSKGAISEADRKEFSSVDNISQRCTTQPTPRLSNPEDNFLNDTTRSHSESIESKLKSIQSPRRTTSNPPLSSSPDSLDSLRTESSSGTSPYNPYSSLIIFISSCTSCPHCYRHVYDEQIVTLWAPEDRDFQITCEYCNKEMIPKLTILMREAIVKETVQKRNSSQTQNTQSTKSLKSLFKKSISSTDHASVMRKSSITLPQNPVVPHDATLIPYTFGDGPERRPNAIIEDPEMRTPEMDDDLAELHCSYDDTHFERNGSNFLQDDTFQYYRSFTSGVKTLPKRNPVKRNRRPQLRNSHGVNLHSFVSSGDVRARVQSVYVDSLTVNEHKNNRMSMDSVFSLDMGQDMLSLNEDFPSLGYMEEENQSVTQFIRDNVEGTTHILFNKDAKGNCLPDDTSMPFLTPIGSKTDRRLSSTFFPDDCYTVDPYLKLKEELASKLESMPLRSGYPHSGASTPSGRGSPDVRAAIGKYEDYISIPYLSPLVLRKSLENLVSQEGPGFLNTMEFVKKAPFIYWNLVWYFQRLGLRSHLQDILLRCVQCKKCYIETLWEPIGPEIVVPYLHSYWKIKGINNTLGALSAHRRLQQVDHVLQAITNNIECLELVKAARHILDSRKLDSSEMPTPSLYREMLLLFLVLTKDELNGTNTAEKLQRYDRHYKQMMSYIPKEYSLMLTPYDHIPSDVVIHCRKIFGPLRIL